MPGRPLRLDPLSTQDDVAAALVQDYEIPVFAIRGEDNGSYSHITAAVDFRPHLTMDDGADVVGDPPRGSPRLPGRHHRWNGGDSTGVIRLRALEAQGELAYPIVAVNEADYEHLFDNRYGTGQSTVDGIIRATNILLAGRKFVIASYGWVGRGVAMRARGMGAHVIVTEVDPMQALEALMDGFEVRLSRGPRRSATSSAPRPATRTSSPASIERLKDGAVLANTGHFNVEIDIPSLKELATETRIARTDVEEFTLADGRHIYLIADGRLVSLSAAEAILPPSWT